MHFRHTLFLVLALALFSSAAAQDEPPIPVYTPPDRISQGDAAYYRDLAIIETACTDWHELRARWKQLTEQGALIAVITSPQRWLGWVPREAQAAVRSVKLNTALGTVAVRSISYNTDEFRATAGARHFMAAGENSEADEALVSFLALAKRNKTPDEIRGMEDRLLELDVLAELQEPHSCVTASQIPAEAAKRSTMGDSDPVETSATRPVGLVVHSSFFLESQPGSGSWNWDNTVYSRYLSFYVDAMAYWTSLASKYGRSMTKIWLNYGPNHWAMQINGEPVSVGEHSFIPTVVNRLRPPGAWDYIDQTFPVYLAPFLKSGLVWGKYYNNKLKDAYNADQSIFGCIAWKGTPDEGIWPHAEVISWANGDREGIYFAMDVRYWQAGLNPSSAPNRNVIAHEIGHLWGSPDEYRDDNCGFSYRGIANINCQKERSAGSLGRSGWQVHGFDAMMVGNYLSGASSATPVHTGLISASAWTPLRCISTSPANGQFTITTCDNTGYSKATRSWSKSMCLPLEYDFCNKITVPLTRNISGSTWYFDYWEIKRKNGGVTNVDYAANVLQSWQYTSSRNDPVVDIKAVYTNSPPDVFAVNNTLTAHLAPADNGASPARGIALRWRNKFDMSKADTKIEYERTPGLWVEVAPVMDPFPVGINQWTGALITRLPLAGGGTAALAANTQYRFRIVGYFNTVKGNYSTIAQLATRPASPADTVYCADTFEPNTAASPRVLTSSGPGMAAYTVDAACPILPRSAEWSWFVPKNDYYRMTVINLSNMTFGERLQLTLRVRPGSDFRPKFTAQRTSGGVVINASPSGGNTYKLTLSADGEYNIMVEPQMGMYYSYRFVDPSQGFFGFGEYTMDVERVENRPSIAGLCPECVRITVMKPFSGILVSKVPGEAFEEGLDRRTPRNFDLLFDPPPGFSFDGWDLPKPDILQDPKANPTRIVIGPNQQSGEYEIGARLKPIAANFAELVIVYPNGPDGPLTERTLHPGGSVVNAQALNTASYQFAGWSNDTSSTTNPLAVTMWRSKMMIAVWKEKPCVPEPMSKWTHELNLRNARQGSVALEYGMQEGAGDGLEAGQPDLPPFPPAGTFDVRWINITGSNGSTTDLRAVKQNHIYQARIQTGAGLTPVTMSWSAPPSTPNASYAMTVQGAASNIDMRSVSSYTFTDEGTYIVRVEVKAPVCPPKTKEPEVVVVPVRTDPGRFPCVEFGLQFRDRKDDTHYPLYNPYQFHLFEKSESGELLPARVNEILQLPEMTLFRLCTDPSNPKPDREIVVVNDDQDEESKKDTIVVNIPVPVPDGTGQPTRFVQQHSGDWELVSLPLDVKNTSSAAIFPGLQTLLYGFDPSAGNYSPVSDMAFGDGYWLKTDSKSTTYYGLEKLSFDWNSLNGLGEPYGYGWNLIGSLSKPVAASSIVQTPVGGLLSLFGYNPVSGYVVPSNIETGKGYWVRVNPGTRLRLQSSGFTGGTAQTAYLKAAASLGITASLKFVSGEAARTVMLTDSRIPGEMADLLQLPQPPPGESFDVRTETGTLYVPREGSALLLSARGEVAITSSPELASGGRYELLDERNEILAVFDGNKEQKLSVRVDGAARLYLKTAEQGTVPMYSLEQNYPNPFVAENNEFTTVAFSLSEAGPVRLVVYDVMGRVVRTLLEQEAPAGVRHIRWDGRDDRGDRLPQGAYVLRLQSAAGTLTRVMNITTSR